MPNLLKLFGVACAAAILSGCAGIGFIDVTGLTSYASPDDPAGVKLAGRVYILRGIGHIWSGGMTEMANTLNRRGVTASAHKHSDWRELADEAIKLYKSDPERWPIILVGHSNGGDNIINMAYRLQNAGVPVALAVGFDPTRFNRPVPKNVRRFINLYQSTNLLGGGFVEAVPGFRGQLVNVNLRNHPEIGHMNMDKSRRLQEEVVAKVLQVAALPTADPAPLLSISYVVPDNAKIELWDGGVAVTLQPGETLEALAAQYGVPVWAILQASGLPEVDAPAIEPGQRLVIPRNENSLPPAGTAVPMASARPDAVPTASMAQPLSSPGFAAPRAHQPRLGVVGQ
jgi:thioesterase domain-containing protein